MKYPYKMLFWMGILHIPIMYVLMFAMVDTFDDVIMNLNTFYMAIMMASPMVIMMPLTMLEMYPNKNLNIIVFGLSFIILIGSFYLIRNQVLIGDKQFIRSMIPHHSGAILMCQDAKLSDPELKALCDGIVTGQRQEIVQMKKILDRM